MRIKGLSQNKPKAQTDIRLPDLKPKSAVGRAIGATLLVELLGSWAVAEMSAKTAGFPAGVPGWLGGHLYMPWAGLQWVGEGLITNPHFELLVLAEYGLTIPAAIAAGFVVHKVMSRKFKRKFDKQNLDLHGSARWATEEEMLKMNILRQGQGVYIGGYENPKTGKLEYLRHNGPEHILVAAPTRSGKGVGLVIPTLLEWRHSAIIYDIKGELFALTSGFRKAIGQKIFCFSPSVPYKDGNNARFNPLDEIRLRTPYEVQDAQNVAQMVVDPEGKGADDHWVGTGSALLTGVILHVLYSWPNKTLNGCSEFLQQPNKEQRVVLTEMVNTKHDEVRFASTGGTCPAVMRAGQGALNKSDNELSGVISTATKNLALYEDEVVAGNTACSDFRISDLVMLDEPASLYIVTSPADALRLRPIIRLMITQIIQSLTREMKFENGRAVSTFKHRLLLMLDEFPSLRKLEVIPEALAVAAGYGLKFFLITQDLNQLYDVYGQYEKVSGNCHIFLAYAPNNMATAKTLSEATGQMTVRNQTESYSGKKSSLSGLDGISQSEQHVSRPLLTVDEVRRLRAPEKVKDADGTERIVRPGAELIFVAGSRPIYGTQILYFQDPIFSKRAKIPAPAKSDRVVHENVSETVIADEIPETPFVLAAPPEDPVVQPTADGPAAGDTPAPADGTKVDPTPEAVSSPADSAPAPDPEASDSPAASASDEDFDAVPTSAEAAQEASPASPAPSQDEDFDAVSDASPAADASPSDSQSSSTSDEDFDAVPTSAEADTPSGDAPVNPVKRKPDITLVEDAPL